MMHYILDANGEPQAEPDFDRFVQWSGDNPEAYRVALDEIGDVRISTVFLSLDHSFTGPPVLWETMVFGGLADEEQRRYTSLSSAHAGHERVGALLREQN